MSFLKRTPVAFWNLPAKSSWRAFFSEEIFFSEQMHEAAHGSRRSLWRPDQLCSVCSARKKALMGSCPDTALLTQEARSRSGSACSVVKIIRSSHQRELRAGKLVAVRRGMPG